MKRRELLVLLGSAAVAWPLETSAQQKAMPTVGYLHFASPGSFTIQVAAFHRGLGEAGYVDGRNVAIEYRWAEGHYDRLPALAADLVGRKVSLIVAFGNPGTVAAKTVTSTIPIVFIFGDDPVEEGFVASLARPGGNLTGVSTLFIDLVPKRLELLSELAPRARIVALVVNPNSASADRIIREAQEAARAKGVQLPVLKAGTGPEIEAAFTTLTQLGADAVLVGNDPFFASHHEQFVALAERAAVAAIYPFREFAGAGGLISYGPSLTAMYHQAGSYAGKILKGAKPADLPVEQPTRFELVINVKTAKALGLTVPQAMLARADEVIE
jgi:putative ABC transport system substrate-binding protein